MKSIKMIDITHKPESYREAIACGKIILRKETIDRIKRGEIEKGDVFTTSQLAAILAAKRTPEILPLCHSIPITGIDFKWELGEDYIEVQVTIKTKASTGVEMEALTATAIALLNIWDMVKKYEKDEAGQYPWTRITDIKVISKIKASPK